MAVTKPWVGSTAKAETGMAWMGDARVALRLPRAGWMSEMVGRSKEIRFVNNTNRTEANIYELMGSPTEVTTYVFENNVTISAATQGGWALQTGAFPAGSTLTIINRGFIRGGGGNGGPRTNSEDWTAGKGQKGGDAIILDFPVTIDNSQGYIYAGGGGGNTGQKGDMSERGGGGGGAGTPAGIGTAGGEYISFDGTELRGGKGASAGPIYTPIVAGGLGGRPGVAGEKGTRTGGNAGTQEAYSGGGGGGVGAAGGSASDGTGGEAGRAVVRNGHALTWAGGNGVPRVYGAVV